MTRIPSPAACHGTVAVSGLDQVRLRPLVEGETQVLEKVFAGMSATSRYFRYLAGISRLSGAMVDLLTAVDGMRHAAWVALAAGEPVGIGRYVSVPGSPRTADIAVEVVDDHQRRGIGTALVEAVAITALDHGIVCLAATLDPDNHASRALLSRFGARIRVTDGLAEASGALRVPRPGVLDPGRVRGLCRHCAGDLAAA